MLKPHRIGGIALLLLHLTLLAASAVHAQVAPPVAGAFIQDLAGMITHEDAALIQEQASRLLTEHSIPVVVLTVNSLAEHYGEGYPIESLARYQFESWGSHPEFSYSDSWRRGILLLVAKEDRKARIELGGDWTPEYVPRSIRIMDKVLVPAFKRGNYSEGIASGVTALGQMSRGEDTASSVPPEWFWLGMLVAVFLALFLIAWFFDRNRRAGDVAIGLIDWMTTPSFHFRSRGTRLYGNSFGGRSGRNSAGVYTGGGHGLFGGFDGFGGGGGSFGGGGGGFGGGGGASGSW